MNHRPIFLSKAFRMRVCYGPCCLLAVRSVLFHHPRKLLLASESATARLETQIISRCLEKVGASQSDWAVSNMTSGYLALNDRN